MIFHAEDSSGASQTGCWRIFKKRRRPGRTNTGLVFKYGAKVGGIFGNKTFCAKILGLGIPELSFGAKCLNILPSGFFCKALAAYLTL